MNDIWNVMFTNLVAEIAANRAELQRVVNLKNTSVGNLTSLTSEALANLVLSEAKLSKWQEMKPEEPKQEKG